MNSSKKITSLFLTPWYPNKKFPLSGIFIRKHALCIAQFADVIVLFVESDIDVKKGYILEDTIYETIREVRINYSKTTSNIPLLSNLIKTIRFLKAQRKGIRYIFNKYGKPDIVHVNVLTRCGIIAYLLKICNKIPYIITEHWSRYLENRKIYKGFLRKFLTSLIVKNAHTITTVSNDLKNSMIKRNLYNKNYEIIYNVVDTDLFIIKEKSKRTNINRIIHISNFIDDAKNIYGILRVIKKLSEIRTDFQLQMIGMNEGNIDFEEIAEQMGLKNKFVFFTGMLTGNDLTEEINNADFKILFSNYENLPVVILECWACGIPVITTNVGGIPEHMDNTKGIFIQVGNEDDLLQKILFMFDNSNSFKREIIRKYAVENFSKNAIANNFLKIYNKVLNV